MGLSVSTTTINNTVNHLSNEAGQVIRGEGQKLLTFYTYDNLDINLKHMTPILEKSADTLVHLTTATMMLLRHVSIEDLQCTEQVWKTSVHNPYTGQARPSISIKQLASIHKEPDSTHPLGLQTRQHRFNAWKFLTDLINYGPEYFHQFRNKIKEPEMVDGIPVAKTSQIPLRAMDIHENTPAMNGKVLKEMFGQTGVGDVKENPNSKDVGNLTILVFGDLGTGQHIWSL